MTRKEAIAIIRKEYLCVSRDCDIKRSCGKCDLVIPSKEPILQAYDMAIKALEQEPVLDKISTEIEQVKSIMNEEIINNNRKDLINFVNGLNQSLVIVDKYKAESEDEE